MILVLCLMCRFNVVHAEFTLPASLTEIGDEAFAGCGALNEASVPDSVELIGEDAFSGCGEALLILTEPGSEAVNFARSHQYDYRAGTHYRALLIGQTYSGSAVSPLQGPANDIRALQMWLPQIGWTVTTKSNLTADGIRSAIGTAFQGATENDVNFFYYSGHGEQNGALLGIDGEGLSPESLRSALDNVPGRKVIVVDACYSGKIIEEEDEKGKRINLRKTGETSETEDKRDTVEAFLSSFQAAFRPRLRGALNANNYYVITAARSDEQSVEQFVSSNGSGRIMGIFTYYFCLGIGYNGVNYQVTTLNADVNGDGAVSIQEAFAYAAEEAMAKNPYQHAVVWPLGCRWFAPFRLQS